MKLKWFFGINVISILTILHCVDYKYLFVKGVHLNKKVQNLSIESSGKLLANDDDKESPPDESVPESLKKNDTVDSSTTSTTKATTASSNATETNPDSEHSDNTIEKYIKYNGTMDLRNVTLKNGIAYDINTGLPILPDMVDGFEYQYEYKTSVVTVEKGLTNGIAWLIIILCIVILVIMIIVITIVSCIRHERNSRRRENESNAREANLNSNNQ